MNLNFSFINIIILFGAFQGFILCFFLSRKHNTNRLATLFFILFLFSLAFLNMMYVFIDIDLFKYYRPLHMFPLPYKWLLGVGFYFYVKNQFKNSEGFIYHKKEWFLFIPAIVYGLLKSYWFYISISENSYRITEVLVDANFFRISEFLFLFYTIFLLVRALRFINKSKTSSSNKSQDNLKWLKKFTTMFLGMMVFELCLFSVDLIIHNGQESFLFMYPSLIINVAFIYWIGYLGFVKPKRIINSFKNNSIENNKAEIIQQKLKQAIEVDEIYKNANLTISECALYTNISSKDLSNYINEVHGVNFSEYLNFYRIEKVKELLQTKNTDKFTLLKFAEDAGFSSKSSFNATFKRMVGMTPSAYKKQVNTK